MEAKLNPYDNMSKFTQLTDLYFPLLSFNKIINKTKYSATLVSENIFKNEFMFISVILARKITAKEVNKKNICQIKNISCFSKTLLIFVNGTVKNLIKKSGSMILA